MTGFSHLYVGLSALRAFRHAINNAGNNVANVATPGFARRRIDMASLPDQLFGKAAIGLGVEITTTKRVTDPFLDFAIRREMSRLGGDEQRSELLTQLEPLLGEVAGAPLQTSLSDLFEALNELSIEPDNLVLRDQVVGAAQDLTRTLHRLDEGLVTARTAANKRVDESVTRVNDILAELSEVNRQIPPLEAGGAEAAQLRDARGLLLDELSGLVAVHTIEHENGQLSVFFDGTGDTLLAQDAARPIQLTQDAEGMLRVIVSRGGEKVDLTDQIRGGTLGGSLAVRDDAIPDYRTRLDTFAASVIQEFNAVHAAGFDLDGNPGLALFEPDPPSSTAARDIAVNAALVADSRLLAAADAPGEPGNNRAVLALLGLQDASVAALGGQGLGEYVGGLVADVGRDTASAAVARQASRSIVSSLGARRDAVSGVSLDEEAVQLATFQQSFQAAARFMETVNRVTETALNLLSR